MSETRQAASEPAGEAANAAPSLKTTLLLAVPAADVDNSKGA
ncbi:hypothetical protein AB4Y63_08535 [Leifsonia sp. YAF41]